MPLDSWPSATGTSRQVAADIVERNRLILQAVRDGNAEIKWCPLTLSDGENTLVVQVSCDALKVDGVRVELNAATAQKVADALDALLLTPKLVDQIYALTAPENRLTPKTHWPNDSSTALNIEMSARIDAGIASRSIDATRPLANVGKDWTLVKAIFTPQAQAKRKAANYGLLVETDPWGGINTERTVSLPGVFAIQGVGTVHNDQHEDYSQTFRAVRREAVLNGARVDLADIYTGRAPGTNLVSHEGPLPDWRQPDGGASPIAPPTPRPSSPPQPGSPPPNPPPAAAPPVVAAVGAGGGGDGAPIAFSLLGAGAGALSAGALGAGIGGFAGLLLGAMLRPKRRSTTSSVAEPLLSETGSGEKQYWYGSLVYLWDAVLENWLVLRDWEVFKGWTLGPPGLPSPSYDEQYDRSQDTAAVFFRWEGGEWVYDSTYTSFCGSDDDLRTGQC